VFKWSFVLKRSLARSLICLKDAIRENLGAQAAPALQGGLRPGAESRIHPVAGSAFLGALELDALQLEFLADERFEIQAFRNHIPAKNGRRPVGDAKLREQRRIGFPGEERDLPLVAGLVVEEAVSFDAPSSQASNVRNFDDLMLRSEPPVVAKKIVPRRDVEMADANRSVEHEVRKYAVNGTGWQRRADRVLYRGVTTPRSLPPFSAVLLAGGRSQRMGRDKAALTLGGQVLWLHQMGTLRSILPAEFFISGRSEGPYAGHGVEIVPDRAPGEGPLSGLVASLHRVRTDWLVVLAVDLPRMSSSFLAGLLERACASGKGIVPCEQDRFHPLAAVYPRACLALAMDGLQAGERSLQHFVRLARDHGLVELQGIAKEEQALFENVNTPADFERFTSCFPQEGDRLAGP
jgi:molybdenum cofactor guanylyltransferase